MRITNTNEEEVEITGTELRGREVVVWASVSNAYGGLPVGVKARISSSWRRTFSIDSIPCEACGIKLYMTKVPVNCVRLVPKEGDHVIRRRGKR